MKYTSSSTKDLAQLNHWIELDPAHKDKLTGEFFIPPVDADGKLIPGIQCMNIEDDKGVVFTIRMENAIRVYIQFPPEQEVSKSRVASALRRMFFYLGGGAKKAGYHEVFFNSMSDRLISFFNNFGFKAVENTYQAKL